MVAASAKVLRTAGGAPARPRTSPYVASDAQARLLLVSGGDERLWLDPVTRRNRYGTPAGPATDELWLSSSTASAISPRGWRAAHAALERLFSDDPALKVPLDGWFDEIRGRLLRLYGAPGCEAILSASGTEAELVTLALALRLGDKLTNVVVAPAETGGGVPAAAAGKHFLGRSSLGGSVESGGRLAGWEDCAIAVETIEIRGTDGRPRAAADIDDEAASHADRVVGAGGVCLLHVLDASKTGRPGVSRAAARAIAARHGERVLVVVDACQLRCSAAAIRADLEDGLAVMITGSKFAGGPPFCGALLLPPALVERVEAAGGGITAGMGDYSALFDWPARLRGGLADTLHHPANLGLGLRWSAALAEIEAYEAVPAGLRAELLAAFDGAVAQRIGASGRLRRLDGSASGLAPGLTPIVETGGPGARAVYEALRQPLDTGDARLDRPCHLGQPVVVGEETALRVCASMPMLSDAAERIAAGNSLHAAMAPIIADLDLVFNKWAAISARQGVVVAAPARTDLDPADWDQFRAEAHGALDAMIDRLKGVREGPVWRRAPDEVREEFTAGLPRGPRPMADVLADFDRLIAPYGIGNTHPRFFGWVHGAGTPVGMVAEMLAAGMNANCGGRDHIGPVVERQIAAWAADVFGLPKTSSGLFVTGTSQANFLSLLVARDAALGHGVRQGGLIGAGERLVAYASRESHSCVAQAAELSGVGSSQLRLIDTDADGRMRLDALKSAIVADRAAGLRPFLAVGTAGGVNFGAYDNLTALADICVGEGLWFHVDGAFGALAALSPKLKPLTRGLERADSVAFDFHKWAHAPYDAGFLLVADREAHRGTFASPAAYLARAERGMAAGEIWPCDLGPDLSRGFRALKVWMTFQTLGADAIAGAMEANCAAAAYLAARVEASARFALAAPSPLNIVCFGLKDDATGEANRDLVIALQESGVAAPSTTRIGGREVIRAAIVNHRTTLADIDILMSALEDLAGQRTR